MLQDDFESSASARELRIIIPAHDEAARIEETIDSLWQYFGERASLLVVANGCTDYTAEITRSLARRYPTLELLDISQRIGKGGAVRAGLTFGNEPYVAFMDADGSTAPDQIDILLQTCDEQKLAGAIGSRWLPESRIARKQPLRRRVASRAFNALTRSLFNLPFTDTQCGAKVFRRSAIDSILDQLEIANFAFDVDLLLELKKVGQPVAEVAISWENVEEYSKVRLLRSGPAMVWALARLYTRESILRHIPFVDTLGLSATIPVLSGLDLLFVVSARHRATDGFLTLVEGLRGRGHVVRIVKFDRASAFGKFAYWYVRAGHRQSNAIVHDFGPTGARILECSAKPKFSLSELVSATARDPNAIDAFVQAVLETTHRSQYFSRDTDGWTLAAQRLEPAEIDKISAASGR
jgi:glycosyltransferase involved in cell wall biosynthesis